MSLLELLMGRVQVDTALPIVASATHGRSALHDMLAVRVGVVPIGDEAIDRTLVRMEPEFESLLPKSEALRT